MKTPEQTQPREWVKVDGKPVVWEACQTFSGSWGYYRDEMTWRSTDELIRTLIDCVSKGGNLLLNVGPTGRGEFDERAINRLMGIGAWMKRHGLDDWHAKHMGVASQKTLTLNLPVTKRMSKCR